MTRTLPLQRQNPNRVRLWGGIAAGSLAAALLSPQIVAQTPASRIQSAVANSEMTVLAGSLHPLAQPQNDAGRVPAETRLNGISIFFNRSADQEAELEALLQAQRDPASGLYHQWLTPEQFAARFGMADADLTTVEGWLQEQGFAIDSVARSRNVIRFSGTAGQVESAFRTQMHYYTVGGMRHFAASTDLSLPAAIAPTVLGIRNLDDFRPHSHAVSAALAQPDFTSSASGKVYFAPGDVATVYDINRQYSAGFTGTGQAIAIVGQSSIALSDIQNFQNAAGLAVKAPTLILMPGTGTPQTHAKDEAESDLDLEWSGALAPGATIDFVYTGSNSNYGAFDAMQYAIDQDIAPIISASYGTCEADLSSSPLGNGSPTEPTLEAAFQQAATQGQTLIAASGDDGSTDCFNNPDLTTAQQEAPAVDYPASSPYVTGMGGTEVSRVNEDYLLSGYGYWDAKGSTDIISSALQYLPEVAWNEDVANCGEADCLASSGGGASTLFSKPSWQTGVPGIPNDGQRDVPDVALNASPEAPGYLFCTSDSSFWQTGQTASCTDGFRDGAGGLLTVVGGTSMAAPTFAGMLALINQQQNDSKGQGLVNPTLYTLAANSTTYASAFHDITSGNNDCNAGSAFCSGEIGFSAGVGYDQVTGLGTVDLYNLACAWPANAGVVPCPTNTTTSVTASNTSPSTGVADNFMIAVASTTGSTVPTGDVSVTVDSGTPVSETLAAGAYTYSTTFATAGNHTIVAAYSGDATHAPSTGVVLVTVVATFSLSPTTPAAIAPGSSATTTVTVASVGGYAGTVTVSCALTNSPAGASVTYEPTCSGGGAGNPVILPGSTSPTLTFTVSTTAAGSSAELLYPERVGGHGGWAGAGGGAVLALLLFVGIPARRRSWRSLVGMMVLMAALGGLAGCGGSVSSSGTSTPGTTAGTYTFTLSGIGSPATSSAVTATFTVVVN